MSNYDIKGNQTKGAGNRYRAMNSFQYSPGEAEHWVGGKIPELPKAFFNYLFEQGLKNSYYLLDFGCGCLRCSLPLIAYLNEAHYHGLDGDPGLIAVAKERIVESGLEVKKPLLESSWNFEFNKFGLKHFDFIVSQGVICHMPNNEIAQLFAKIKEFLAPTGEAHLSYLPGTSKNADEGVFKQTAGELSEIAQQVGLIATDQGKWGHPRHLRMIKLTH